jgi:choline dehydrogenase-like flavoprotein
MGVYGDAKKQNTFDAIVIGSGISGGWAAKELCDHGLKTLVLERGKDVRHIKGLSHCYKRSLGIQAQIGCTIYYQEGKSNP